MRLRRYKAKCVKTRCLQEGVGHLEATFQGKGVIPLPIYWYHSKSNWLRYNCAADSFYIMKLCSTLFVLYCRNYPNNHKFRYVLYPHFEEVRGGVEPWLMARWKASVEFLLSVIELLLLSLATEALQGIMKLCSRLFVLYCRNCSNNDKFRYFIPILRKLGAA